MNLIVNIPVQQIAEQEFIERIVNAFTDIVVNIINYLPRILGAIIIVLIGYLLGLIIKNAVLFIINKVLERPLERTKVGKSLKESGIDLGALISSLVMAIVIIVSIIAAIDILQLTGFTGEVVSTIARAILNIVAGITILAIGIPLALIAAEYLSTFLLGPLKEKHGLGVSLIYSISALVLSIFVLALALNVMFNYPLLINSLVEIAPAFIGAGVILLIGYLLGDAIGDIVNKIVESIVAKPLESTDIGKSISEAKIDLPSLIGGLTKAFIIVVAIVAAIELLKIGGLTGELMISIANYLPKLIGGIAILTLGLILVVLLAKYIGRFIRTMFRERYQPLGELAENIIMLGLIAVIVTIALNVMELYGYFVYPLILGVVIIISGIFISEIIGRLLRESYPEYVRLTPFVETIIIIIFVLIGVAAIFSQFEGVSQILLPISFGISIAFAIILLPIVFYYARLAWREAAKVSSEKSE
ncbi:MAG: hypothetical protein QXP71_02335 [Desulfurococcaceae archaeon]